MTLKDRLIGLDARFGVPRNADEAFAQNIRYWWVGLLSSIVILIFVIVMLWFDGYGAVGAAVLSPIFAFASGYYYANRLHALGKRNRLLDRRAWTSGQREANS